MKKIFLICLLTIISNVFAQNTSERKKHYNLENNLAIQGYDPVSYFTKSKAEKGNASYTTTYLGVKYYFISNTNKDLFLKSPSKYEPQFGGWCAYAMGEKGEKVEIDPNTFKIIDGKLYLFYNAFFNNTLKSWNKNETKLKSNAIKNWTKLINN